MDLFAELPHYRVRVREIATDLRGASHADRKSHRYKGISLGIESSDLLPLEAVRADGGTTTAWQGAVADSVVLGLIRADLEDGSLAPTGEPPDSAAQEQALRLLGHGIAADLESVHRSLGKMGPKISDILARAQARIERLALNAPGEAAMESIPVEKPQQDVAAEPALREDEESASEEPSTGEVILELESFLAEARSDLRQLVTSTGTATTSIGIRGLQETRFLTAREGEALRTAKSLTDPEASPTDRLLVLTATASYWIARQHGRLVLPHSVSTPATREMPSGRDTVLGILEHLSRLVVSIRELARNRGDRDLLGFLTLLASRWMDLAAVAETLPPDSETDQATSRKISSHIDVHDFEVKLERAEPEVAPLPSRRSLQASARRRARRPKTVPRLDGRQLLPAAFAIASIGTTVASIIMIMGHLFASGKPPDRHTVNMEELRELVPSIAMPSEAGASNLPHVGVGPEWEDWTPRERARRLTQVCRILGDSNWQRATFIDPDGDTVARWTEGWVRLEAGQNI